MSALSSLWDKLDGKKTVIGWVVTQIGILGEPNILTAWKEAGQAIVQAVVTKDIAPAIEPTMYALGQTLLAVGVAHGIIKKSQATSSSSK